MFLIEKIAEFRLKQMSARSKNHTEGVFDITQKWRKFLRALVFDFLKANSPIPDVGKITRQLKVSIPIEPVALIGKSCQFVERILGLLISFSTIPIPVGSAQP